MPLVQIFFIFLGLYTLLGALFSIVLIFRGIARIDKAGSESGWGFRLIIIPGIVAFWPILLRKWLKNA